MKRILLWVFASVFLGWIGVRQWPVTVHISSMGRESDFAIQMPLKDKKRLEWFFRNACFLNLWAYTLVGTKPMSTHQYTEPLVQIRTMFRHPDLKYILLDAFWPPNLRKICYLFNPEQLKIKLGWETLNKYFDNFPNSRFCLFTHCHGNFVSLVLVDKMKLIKMVKEYLADFQEILRGEGIEPDELSANQTLHEFLQKLKSDALLGTLLGFGRNNARLYEQYGRMDPKERPMSSMWLGEDEAWLEQLDRKDLTLEPWDSSDLFYPLFACDPQSEETKQLRQTYVAEREVIIKYYEGKDVVEATLSLLTQK